MIGDGHNDVKVARAAGYPVVGCTWGYTRVAMSELGPDASECRVGLQRERGGRGRGVEVAVRGAAKKAALSKFLKVGFALGSPIDSASAACVWPARSVSERCQA